MLMGPFQAAGDRVEITDNFFGDEPDGSGSRPESANDVGVVRYMRLTGVDPFGSQHDNHGLVDIGEIGVCCPSAGITRIRLYFWPVT